MIADDVPGLRARMLSVGAAIPEDLLVLHKRCERLDTTPSPVRGAVYDAAGSVPNRADYAAGMFHASNEPE